MSHCIRCGGELPSAGAECPECRIAFKDVLEDSSFLDDDEDDEEFEPAPPKKRVSRFDKYLDDSPVFAGQDDVAPVREPLLRDRRSPASAPMAEPDPEPISEPVSEAAQESSWEASPKPDWESALEPSPEPVPVEVPEPAPIAEFAPAVAPEPVVELDPLAELEAQFAARFAALFENEPEPQAGSATECEPEAEPESETIYVDAEDEAVTSEVVLAPPSVVEAPELAPVSVAPVSVAPDEPLPEAPVAAGVDESITAPVDVVVVLPAREPIGPPEPPSQSPSEPAPSVDPVTPTVDETPVVEPLVPVDEATPVEQPTVQPIAADIAPAVDANIHSGPTNIKITPRYELHSAPAEGSPVVHVLLDIEPSGAPLVTGIDGPLAHVIIALDLSASMNDPRKYPVLTRAIEKMLGDLHKSHGGDVLVSLIVFAYGAEILLRARPASKLDAREVLDLIDRSPLRFSRYTDIVGALTRAGRIALDSHRAMPRVPIRIYVLTDGRPQDIEGARRKMGQIRKIPVDVHGLGFGDDADLDVLQDLISGGRGGTVKHVRSETLSSAFEQIAKVAKRVVAKRALLDVELKGGAVGGASYRFRPARHAYGKRAFENGQHFHTDLGTLESGRRYSLLFQLRLPPTQGDETEIGRVTLRIPGEGGPVTFEHLLFIARHAGSEMPAPDDIVLEARHVVEAVGASDPKAQLKALHARRRLYVEERRDEYIIELIDRAIAQMETKGSLDALSNGERAALQSHTQSIVGTGA